MLRTEASSKSLATLVSKQAYGLKRMLAQLRFLMRRSVKSRWADLDQLKEAMMKQDRDGASASPHVN
jgi:hypothetical protein